MKTTQLFDNEWQELSSSAKTLFKNGFTETEIINEILMAIGEAEEELDSLGET